MNRTDSNKERRGGKQSYDDTSGLPRKKKLLKYTKKTPTELRTEQIIKLPQKKQHMLFSNQRKEHHLLGVLIQLKINTGNEATPLSKRAA